MHQPNVEPHSSSYFTYEIYPYERPADFAANPPARHPVVIVGAGPVGLVLAIQLARNGLKPVLIEAQAQVSGGSRALALTRRSMEIVEQCGGGQQFLDEAIVWKDGYSFYKSTVVHHLDLPRDEDDKFWPMTNLGQCNMEKILVDQAREFGVDLRFQTALTTMDVTDDGVMLTLDTPEGEYRLAADWIVGSDGARSTVRRLQGLRFEGQSYESRFVIADFNIDLDAPPGRRCYFDPPWLPGHSVLMHKGPAIWRLDYQVPDDVSDEEALDPERLQAQIQAQLEYIGADLPWTIEWTTLYKPNTLTLRSYNHGRVLYCGDAAHLLPVFGVRGMNTGIQDSINLGWKLAAVAQGRAHPSLLDTYTSERVADALQICVEAGRSTRMMAPPSRGFRIMQQAVLSLSLNHSFPRELLHWRTSHPIDYATSPLTWQDPTESRFSAGPRPGAPALNAKLQAANPNSSYLLDVVIPAFQVFVFGDQPAQWQAAHEDVLKLRQLGHNIRLIAIRTDGVSPEGADAVVHDAEGRAQARWDAQDGAVYIVRPDQHIGARWKADSNTRVAQVLERVFQPIVASTTQEQA